MVFIKSWDAPVVEGTRAVSLQCAHCHNQTEHRIHVVHSFGVGIVFMKTPLFSVKKYYLVCPTCRNVAQELSSAQLSAYRE